MKAQSLEILQKLRHPTGLFSAAAVDVKTGYDKAWIRDNIYSAMGMEVVDLYEAVKTYQALLDIMKKHEYKIDWAIREKPKHSYQYIHARYHPHTYDEFDEEWGNKQNDAVGAFLFKVGELTNKGIQILRNESDKKIIQKLVYYLHSIEYWQDPDNGIWEEAEEVHASSIGACVAGLREVRKAFPDIKIPDGMLQKGREALRELLPRESETKEVDLALLSLIWPYRVVSKTQRAKILKHVEHKLLRTRGILRYEGDKYYAHPKTNAEAEWTMGLPWLAKIYKMMGNNEKYVFYMLLTKFAMNKNGELPELYYGNTAKHNENSPLGWSQALYLVAMSDDVR